MTAGAAGRAAAWARKPSWSKPGGSGAVVSLAASAFGELPLGKQGHRVFPGRFVLSQPAQQPQVGLKHIVQQPCRKQLFHNVVVQYQRAVFNLAHLVIQPHLRRLADAIDLFAQYRGRLSRDAEPQHAGENDRHDRRGRHFPQLAQHPYSTKGPVLQVAPELLLDPHDFVFESFVLPILHGQHNQRRKIADDLVDLRVYRQPVEEGQVESKALALAPGRQHFGESRQQDGRRREPKPRAQFL